MGEKVATIAQEASRRWQELGRARQLGMAVVGIGTLVLLAVLAAVAGRQEYSTLYTRLPERDAAAIVEKLKAAKIPYELADGGTSIRVPSQKVYEVRLELASQGLPQGGVVGFELFNQPTFGLTDFAQRLNYQRGLEGELSRTISRLDAVEYARVHLAIPQPSLYTDRSREPTASVVLQLRPGMRMEQSQVRAIGHLVASSVEGLKPQNVTVVDTSGNTLSDQIDLPGSSSNISVRQMEVQRSYEVELERRILSMLERAVGPNRAMVRVSAVLDWDQVEVSTENFSVSGLQPVVRNSRQVEERGEGPLGRTPGGVPGTDSNIPSYQGQDQAQTGNSRYERKDTTTSYEVPRSVEKVVRSPGAVKRLSVGVMLDATVDQEQAEALRSAIAAAAGVDERRGDTINLVMVPFYREDDSAQRQMEAELRQREQVLEWARTAVLVVGVLVGLLLLRRTVLAVMGRAGPAPVIQEVQPVLPSGPAALPTVPTYTDVQDRQKRMLQQEVANLARTNPRAVARLLETWIAQDRSG